MLTHSNNKNKILFIGWILLFASVSFVVVWFNEKLQTWLVVLAGVVVGILLEWISQNGSVYDVPDATYVWHKKPMKGPRMLWLIFIAFYMITSVSKNGLMNAPSLYLLVSGLVSFIAHKLLNKQEPPVSFFVKGPVLELVGLWHMSQDLSTLQRMHLHGMTERLTLRFSNQSSIELSLKDVNDEGIRVLIQYCEQHSENDLELSQNLRQYSSR